MTKIKSCERAWYGKQSVGAARVVHCADRIEDTTISKIQVIQTWEELEQISAEWNELLTESDADCIFLTWDWIDSWRQTVGESIKPYVVVARSDEGQLVGIGPFYQSKIRLLGVLSFRALRIMGDFPTGAAYSDWIVRSDSSKKYYGMIASHLAEQRDWDCIWMPLVASWNGALDRISDASQHNHIQINKRDVFFSKIDLPEDLDAYELSLSRSSRQDLRRASRGIWSDQECSLSICSDKEVLPTRLRQLFDLNTKRWASINEEGVFFRKPTEAKFYEKFAPVALERGWLRLLSLENAYGTFAAEIGYVYNGEFKSIQAGFDPDGPKSSGRAIFRSLVDMLISEGIRTLDFMCGSYSYKKKLGAKEREGHDVFLTRKSLRTLPLWLTGFWPRGRFLKLLDPTEHTR